MELDRVVEYNLKGFTPEEKVEYVEKAIKDGKGFFGNHADSKKAAYAYLRYDEKDGYWTLHKKSKPWDRKHVITEIMLLCYGTDIEFKIHKGDVELTRYWVDNFFLAYNSKYTSTDHKNYCKDLQEMKTRLIAELDEN